MSEEELPKGKYGETIEEKEEWITIAMKCYGLSRAKAEEWYLDEEALNL